MRSFHSRPGMPRCIVRSHIVVASDADQAAVETAVLADDKVIANLDGATPRKIIFIPGRMVNIVI